MTRIVVLGGGIAGLTAAFRLLGEGREVTVIEASPRLGGAIRTERVNGLALEGGPNTLRTTEAADRLIRDLDLDGDVVSADGKAPRWIVRGGRPRAIVPGPPGLFTSALTLAEKVRVLGEWRVPRRAASVSDESVHDFFRRRFGDGVARYAAGPIVSGVYADDPATLSVRSAFPRLWLAEERSGSVLKDFLAGPKSPGPRYRPRTLNFRGGLLTLIDRLAERLAARGATVRLGVPVTDLDGPLTGGGAPWRLRLADGGSLEADVVLSTVDGPALARLLQGRLPRSAERLSALRSSALAVAIQTFAAGRPEDAPRGFGALIPRGEGFRALGVLYPSSLFPGAHGDAVVTTSFLGGALEPDLPSLDDAALTSLAEAEVRRLHPRLGSRTAVHLVRWPKAIPRLPLSHHATLLALDQDLAELDSRAPGSLVVTGGFRDGVALGERIARAEEHSAGLAAVRR